MELEWRDATFAALLRQQVVVKLAILFFAGRLNHGNGVVGVMLIRSVPLRGIADSTKHESAPPAGAGTVKEVTDHGGGLSLTQLDNYTTSNACSNINDLGNFQTIRINR